MTDESIPLNKAVEKAITFPPAVLETFQKEPERIVELTRAQLAIIQDRMVRKVLQDPQATLNQFATVHERLSKNANLTPQQVVGGSTQVVINFVRAGKEPLTIEATPSTKQIEAPREVD